MPAGEFENVFAPFVKERFLNVEQILLGIRAGAILPESLPPEAQRAVDAELKVRTRRQVTRSALLVLLLGAMGEARRRTRLQRCLFLADRQLARMRGAGSGRLVYDWRPHPHGPFSESLDICISEAIDDRTIEAFPVRESGRGEGVGYRLTARGRAEFNAILQTLETSLPIRALLGRFQGDPA